jgi:hypothetical protein
MKILLLGGPKFLGRHIIEAVLEDGHELTLFNRGQTFPDLFPQVEKLRGNRDGNLASLQNRSWDAAIPAVTCRASYANPREVLKDAVGHYTFISSLSVYTNFRNAGMDESAPVGRLEDETLEEITGESYGPLKALCEQVVELAFPGRTLQVRAGLIVGPYDPTDRFTYWPVRIAGWRSAGTWAARDSGTADPRATWRWIVRMIVTEQDWGLQCHRSRCSAAHVGPAGDLPGSIRQQRLDNLAAGRVPAGTKSITLERAAPVDPRIRPGRSRILNHRLRKSDWRGIKLPTPPRNRPGDAGLGKHPTRGLELESRLEPGARGRAFTGLARAKRLIDKLENPERNCPGSAHELTCASLLCRVRL